MTEDWSSGEQYLMARKGVLCFSGPGEETEGGGEPGQWFSHLAVVLYKIKLVNPRNCWSCFLEDGISQPATACTLAGSSSS